ncbi:uncharacterized protein LOC117652978 [Thrips palmi]|uniref:Uncharacterized protein LOC117652978 n=1 Tax=Thrips palmi TaxID=161013 RepID=A0A6P9A9C7_THRPL|nr:uncharacterized protein LOC117652978 [Thrips palmi]
MKLYAGIVKNTELGSRLEDAVDFVAQDALYHNECFLVLKPEAKRKLSEKDESENIVETRTMALSKIISDLCQAKMTVDLSTPPVFYMSEIQKRFKKCKGGLGDCHSTRLRKRLLAACPLSLSNRKETDRS